MHAGDACAQARTGGMGTGGQGVDSPPGRQGRPGRDTLPVNGTGPHRRENGPGRSGQSRVIANWMETAVGPHGALTLSGAGRLSGMIVGATAPNAETIPLPVCRCRTSCVAGPFGNQRRIASSCSTTCQHLAAWAWPDAVGAQPGWSPHQALLWASAAILAVMVSLPGGLLRHRELRGLRPARRAGRQTTIPPAAGVPRAAFLIHPGRRHAVEDTAVGVTGRSYGDPVLRGIDRRPRTSDDGCGPDDPQGPSSQGLGFLC